MKKKTLLHLALSASLPQGRRPRSPSAPGIPRASNHPSRNGSRNSAALFMKKTPLLPHPRGRVGPRFRRECAVSWSVVRLAHIEGARRRGRPTKNSTVFIREHLPTFAGLCLSRPRRPCPLLFCLGPLRRADPTFFFDWRLCARFLGTMWAGRPHSLRGGADGDVGAPGTAFIRGDSRAYERADQFYRFAKFCIRFASLCIFSKGGSN